MRPKLGIFFVAHPPRHSLPPGHRLFLQAEELQWIH